MSSRIKEKAISLKSSGVDLGSRLALRPAEAAAALGISGRTFRMWMRDEELPFPRVAGVVLVPTAGLAEWLVESAPWGCVTW